MSENKLIAVMFGMWLVMLATALAFAERPANCPSPLSARSQPYE